MAIKINEEAVAQLEMLMKDGRNIVGQYKGGKKPNLYFFNKLTNLYGLRYSFKNNAIDATTLDGEPISIAEACVIIVEVGRGTWSSLAYDVIESKFVSKGLAPKHVARLEAKALLLMASGPVNLPKVQIDETTPAAAPKINAPQAQTASVQVTTAPQALSKPPAGKPSLNYDDWCSREGKKLTDTGTHTFPQLIAMRDAGEIYTWADYQSAIAAGEIPMVEA
jgi:hypothetical protein